MAVNTSSLRFDTSNTKYVKLGTSGSPPSLRGMGTFTWMAWVKVNTTLSNKLSKRAYVERQGSGTGVRFAAVPSKDRLRFELCVVDGGNDTNYDFVYAWDENWHHIAFVGRVEGANPTYQMFLDGQSVQEGTLRKSGGDTTKISDSAPIGGVCYVGTASYHKSGDAENFLWDNMWHGRIDDIAIFNTAKSQGDIQAWITRRNTLHNEATTDVDMFSYWAFNENTGSTTTDIDNPGWVGTMYLNGSTSSALWTTDVPYLGTAVATAQGPLDTTAPAQVTGVVVDQVTTDGFRITWNPTTDNVNVQKYNVLVSQFSDMSSPLVYPYPVAFSVASSVSMTIDNLLPNQPYYVRVTAIDAANNTSTPSTTVGPTTTLAAGDVDAPDKPANVTVSSITYSSFVITITPDTSPEAPTGYKIDIATDDTFNNYVSGWRNKDNASLTTATVTGLDPLTPYYIRVRQYDAVGNESVNFGPVTAVTSSRPDLTAPSPVDAEAATSVDGRRFTANWEEGVDNVGVTGYYLDVSTSSTFGSYLTGYQNLNVGNVLSYLVTGLTEDTTYYYRVRAYDAAGNISDNDGYVAEVTTKSLSLEDGDETLITLTMDDTAYTNSAAATTVQSIPNDPWRLNVLGDGTNPTRKTYFQFTVPSNVVATTSVILYAFIQNPCNGTGSFRVGLGTINSSTLTWNTQPTPTNGPFAFTHGAINTWQAINLTPYVTGPGTYIVSLEQTSTDTAIYWSNRYEDSTKVPYVEIEYSLSPLTRIEQLTASELTTTITNLVTNPNFEANVTTGWTRNGTGGTLGIHATNGVGGTKALQTVHNANSANASTSFSSIAVAANESVTVTFSAFTDTPSAIFESRGTFTGTSGSRNDVLSLGTSMQQFSYTYKAGNAAGTFVWSLFLQQNAAAVTVYIDNVIITKTTGPVDYFDGSTAGAAWSGTANLSTSSMQKTRMITTSTYLGDSDDDNSVIAAVRRRTDNSWTMLPTLAIAQNRTTNTVDAIIPQFVPFYNLLPNPSFEVNTTGWSSSGSATFVRDETYAENGTAACKVTTAAVANSGIQSGAVYGMIAGDKVNARASVMADLGVEVQLTIRFLNSANSTLSETTATVGTSRKTGAGYGTWLQLSEQATAPANTVKALIFVKLVSSSLVTIFYVDSTLINVGAFIPPYRDGSFDDAYFSGASHGSPTFLKIIPNTEYDAIHQYTDADGILDYGGTTAQVATSFMTSVIPTLQTIVGAMTLTPTTDSIEVVIPFQGDDNKSMTALLYVKRTDQSDYTLVQSFINRNDRTVNGTITDLTPGTSYDVRVVFTDSDGLSNTVNGVVTGIATTLLSGVVAEAPSLITFGGFVLNDETARENRVMVTKHDAFGFPDRRVDIEEIPRQDGAVETQAHWGRRTIRMSGAIEGNSRSELQEAIDQFKRAMMPRLQPLIINSLSNTGRRYLATVQSLDIDEVGGQNFRHIEWSAQFVCADPFAYSVVPSVYGPISVTSNSDVFVTSAGGYDTNPVITLTTTATRRITVDVTNQTTGERITPERGVLVDDILTIDTAACSVVINGKEIGYSGMFPRLFAGQNRFTFTFSGGPLFVTIKWTDRYL